MKRKLLIRSALVLLAMLLAVLAIPTVRLTLFGLLHGERFYEGRPTSYWLYFLTSGSRNERNEAIAALAAIGSEAVPRLITIVACGDSDDAVSASAALGSMGPNAGPAAVEALVDAFRSGRSSVFDGQLERMGPAAVESLMSELDDPDPKIQQRGIYELGKFGPLAAPAIPKMIQILRVNLVPLDGSSIDSSEIIPSLREALPKIGAAAVPALVALLDDNNPLLREFACDDLGRIGPAAREALPALTKALEDPWEAVRVQAAEAIWKIDPHQIDLILPVLKHVLNQGKESETVSDAAGVLADVGPPAVPILVAALENGKMSTRAKAAESLGKLGAGAKEAAPALVAALADIDATVQFGAEKGIEGIGPAGAAAVPNLVLLLDAADYSLRDHAAQALGKIGPAAKEAVPKLTANLADKNDSVRTSAAQALGAIGSEALPAAPALKGLLAAEGAWERAVAAEALWRITGDQQPLLDQLRKEGESYDQYALDAVVRIGPASPWVVPAIAASLTQGSDSRKELVARTLSQFGPAASGAVPQLVQAIKAAGPTTYSGEKITESLAKIDPDAAASVQRPDIRLVAIVVVAAFGAIAGVWLLRNRRGQRLAAINSPNLANK